ncbi:LacI family DNA-binding transcriptional regulator [Solwaraspora sp. WMMA2065]|uniref:LacI family DNA-binding transcriptional regulator n=1 Tax=Solwaraspora sp. WMMA2065 TaxID=3015166 RepID=UPI00259BC3A8|nr:LacI family DNA-binding transcriptional regulator [Solwaraspora sp. WMMA2065]WJK34821.1 LacI family DNA-binding transcriptional regulator [Solwaraspora sp. WMMA2065]WJK34853.1 LacI family DNA-binding transcriptional regulator [Solwaraspora sp. WMMA2065]
MTRIDDVARLAGVSTATVSRALRGLPTVTEATRLRVLDAAAQLGYIASPSASRLAGGKTRAVAVVVPRITRWFFSTVVEAAENTLQEAGYDLLLYNLGGRENARQRMMLHTASLRHRVDALMLVATPLHRSDFAAISALGMPGVTVSSGTGVPGWPSIRIDDVAAARTATGHLIGLGHRRIAHISGNSGEELAFTAHLDRRRGYREALVAAGLTPDPALDVEGDFTIAGGGLATTELLRRGPVPTAIFAACDEMALGAIAVLRQAGLRVPADVSVIGIDDHDVARVVGLTTVAQPAAEQGRLAAGTLLGPLAAGTLPGPLAAGPLAGTAAAPTDAVILPTRLVVRESTAPPRETG